MAKQSVNILIVEDDLALNQQMAEMIQDAGYGVDSCHDGESGLLLAKKGLHQLMLLDVMLPGRDGVSTLRMLRKTSQMPVIMATAKGAEEERITGLQIGADDYISKPFNTTELLLRIEALLRRSQPVAPPVTHHISLDDLTIDMRAREVNVNDTILELTAIQFNILWELVVHRGETLSKAYLSQQVLNRALGAYDRGLDMHISRVRRKLDSAGWPGERLQTVHGEGYCLK